MRKRRKKSEMPFAEALEFARKRLVKAQKEHEIATASLASLNAEIPSLMSTIDVLQKALEPSKIRQPLMSEQDIKTLERKYYNPVLADNPGLLEKAEAHATAELDEETLLPEPDGVELLPE